MGGYRWLEARLFEVLGGWVTAVPEPEVKVHLHARSHQHGHHSELWREVLAGLGSSDPDRLTAPANGKVPGVVEAMAEPGGRDRTLEKLVGAYRVLVPRLVAAYTRHLQGASPVTGDRVVLVLSQVVGDEVEGWRQGEMLVQSVIVTESEVRRAAAHQARLEALVVAAGAVAGPGSADRPPPPAPDRSTADR